MSILEIKYRWVDVQSSQGASYRFPNAATEYMRLKYAGPALYRWTVRTSTMNLRALYIGETDDLVRRIRQYLAPGKTQFTNQRLKAYFNEAVGRDERVELQRLEFDAFHINKVEFSTEKLGNTHLRRMLENLMLVWLHADAAPGPPVILNQVFRQNLERRKKREGTAAAALKELGLNEAAIQQVISKSVVRKTSA